MDINYKVSGAYVGLRQPPRTRASLCRLRHPRAVEPYLDAFAPLRRDRLCAVIPSTHVVADLLRHALVSPECAVLLKNRAVRAAPIAGSTDCPGVELVSVYAARPRPYAALAC